MVEPLDLKSLAVDSFPVPVLVPVDPVSQEKQPCPSYIILYGNYNIKSRPNIRHSRHHETSKMAEPGGTRVPIISCQHLLTHSTRTPKVPVETIPLWLDSTNSNTHERKQINHQAEDSRLLGRRRQFGLRLRRSRSHPSSTKGTSKCPSTDTNKPYKHSQSSISNDESAAIDDSRTILGT